MEKHSRIILPVAMLACGLTAIAQAGSSAERQQALSLEQQGRNVEAESAWRALSVRNPSSPEPLAHLGLLESRQEHYPEAIRYYRQALAIAPNMPALRPNLGLAYFKSGDYRNALAMFQPILKSHPDDPQFTLLVGMSYYGLGEYAQATTYLTRAAARDPQNLTLLLTLAHSCLFAHQYPCVLDTFHKIVALNAESAEADMLVGEALDEMKDPVGAQREFRAAIAANPKEPNVHFGLGYLLWTKGQFAEAGEQFQAELENNPKHVPAMLYLADCDLQRNQPDQALPWLEKVAALSPDNAMAHRDLGILYADRGESEKALSELRQAIRLSPKDANAHYRLARLYRSMGRREEANAEFKTVSGLNKAEDERLVKVMSRAPSANEPTAPK
ncbi:tetratricopeptide repeat protein [Acidobacteria bacterium AB60]|nr:tetratricopeptide repeat protein [Acidobacteria bacterium AB60]